MRFLPLTTILNKWALSENHKARIGTSVLNVGYRNLFAFFCSCAISTCAKLFLCVLQPGTMRVALILAFPTKSYEFNSAQALNGIYLQLLRIVDERIVDEKPCHLIF